MDHQQLLTGCGLDQTTTARLGTTWTTHVAPQLPGALAATYAFCDKQADTRAFLWGQGEQEWVRGQMERWERVFAKGLDPAHIERVRDFAKGDLESGMNPAVYGQFFSALGRSLNANITRQFGHSAVTGEATTLVSTLMAAEATIAAWAYSEAQSQSARQAIQDLTGSMDRNVGEVISGVAGASQELSSSMATIRDNVERNLDHATDISATVHGAVDQLQELSAEINQIRQVLEAIKGIAFQTNMLALNATIEAARAGEAGQSFSVVAREVKSLADNSRSAAEGIGQTAERLGETLGTVRASFQEVTTRVQTMVDAIRENGSAAQAQHRATGEIVERMTTLDQQIDQAITAIRQQYAA